MYAVVPRTVYAVVPRTVKGCGFRTSRRTHPASQKRNPCEYARGDAPVRTRCDMPCTHLPAPGRYSPDVHDALPERDTSCATKTTRYAHASNDSTVSTPQRQKTTRYAHEKRHAMHTRLFLDLPLRNVHAALTRDDTSCTKNAHGMHTLVSIRKPPRNRYGMRHEMRIAYALETTRHAHTPTISQYLTP